MGFVGILLDIVSRTDRYRLRCVITKKLYEYLTLWCILRILDTHQGMQDTVLDLLELIITHWFVESEATV
jgi:hypothetical protein